MKNKYQEQLFLYNKATKNILIIVFSFVIIIAAFLLSKLYIPNKINSPELVTPFNVNIEYSENRTANIISCIYDKDKDVIEVLLLLSNYNTDSINEYYYVAVGYGNVLFNEEKMETVEVLNNNLCTVIRIYNVKWFDQIELLLAPKLAPIEEIRDQDTLEIILNKHNITIGSVEDKTEKEYSLLRLDVTEQNINNSISEINAQIKDLEDNNKRLQEDINASEESKALLTQKEIEAVNEKIETLKSTLSSNNESINELKQQINELQKDLIDVKNTKDSYLKTP